MTSRFKNWMKCVPLNALTVAPKSPPGTQFAFAFEFQFQFSPPSSFVALNDVLPISASASCCSR